MARAKKATTEEVVKTTVTIEDLMIEIENLKKRIQLLEDFKVSKTSENRDLDTGKFLGVVDLYANAKKDAGL